MLYAFVHGFNSDSPPVASLHNQFASRDHRFVAFKHGKLGLLGVRSANKNLGDALASCVESWAPFGPLTLIGHSNGCALINRALEIIPYGAVQRVVYLSPAIEHDAVVPEGPPRIDVMHTRKDDAVWWAKFLPWHEWGDMGRRGYTGSDPRVRNLDYTGIIIGHCDWFTDCAWLVEQIIETGRS